MSRTKAWSVGLIALTMVTWVAGCRGCPSSTKSSPEPQRPAVFRVVAFGRVLGAVAPCGCTTQPLGGLPFAMGHLRTHPEGAQLVVEPGSFLYPETGSPEWPSDEATWAQTTVRTATLHQAFARLPQLASGLGPTDVARGRQDLATFPLPRVLANRDASAQGVPTTEPFRMHTLTDAGRTLRLGVTAVLDPSLAPPSMPARAPAEVLPHTLAAMTAAGAHLNVVLVHGRRPLAETLARAGLGDVFVVAVVDGPVRKRAGTPPSRVGNAWVLEAGEHMQTVAQLTFSSDAPTMPPPASWDVRPSRAQLQADLAGMEAQLERLDPAAADPAFVTNLNAEVARLRMALAQGDPQPAPGRAVVVAEQISVTCKLAEDNTAAAALAQYDKTIAQMNRARFADVRAPPPAKGAPSYVGMEACEDCHPEAVEFWQTTRHAGAYATLERDNKQFDLSCVGCHVTGYREPGGSEVVQNQGLRDVQCETCHGPGSLHADDGAVELIARDTTEHLCQGSCHTPEHSDTFAYEPYLRDVLGAGHGEARRARLGEGITGRALREAGFAKAGGRCTKMAPTPTSGAMHALPPPPP